MIFISYKSEEENQMLYIRQQLTEYGYKCWSAIPDILAGGNYMMEIPRAISACDAVVLLLTEWAQKSDWIPDEISQARSRKKLLIAINMDGCALRPDFEFAFQRRQIISAKGRSKEAFLELVRSLEANGIYPDAKKEPELEIESESEPEKMVQNERPLAESWQMIPRKRWLEANQRMGIEKGSVLWLKNGQEIIVGDVLAAYEFLGEKEIVEGLFSCSLPYFTCYLYSEFINIEGKDVKVDGDLALFDQFGRHVGVANREGIPAAELMGRRLPAMKTGDVVYGKDGRELRLGQKRREKEGFSLFRIENNAYVCAIFSGNTRDRVIETIERYLEAGKNIEPLTDANGDWIGFIRLDKKDVSSEIASETHDAESNQTQEENSVWRSIGNIAKSILQFVGMALFIILVLPIACLFALFGINLPYEKFFSKSLMITFGILLAVVIIFTSTGKNRTPEIAYFESFGMRIVDTSLFYSEKSMDSTLVEYTSEYTSSRIFRDFEPVEGQEWLSVRDVHTGEEGYIHVSNLETVLTESGETPGENAVQYDYDRLLCLDVVYAEAGTPLYTDILEDGTKTVYNNLSENYFLGNNDVYFDTEDGEVFLQIEWGGDEPVFVRQEDIQYLYTLKLPND